MFFAYLPKIKMTDETKNISLKKELEYYKKQVDKLAGDHIKNQYLLSKFSSDIKDFTKGFQIIADVQRSFSFLLSPVQFQEQVLDAIITHMSIDKALLFKCDASESFFYPFLWKGFNNKENILLKDVWLSVPDWFHAKRCTLSVSSNASPNEFEKRIRESIHDPYFLITPLFIKNSFWGALYVARKHEVKPMYIPFSGSDIYILESIAGMITALANQLEEHEVLEKERDRIARDMHDDIGSGLTHIALLSELMQIQKVTDDGIRQDLNNISFSARKLVENMSEIIWALSPQNDTLENLLAYLREQTLSCFEPFDINYSVQFPDRVPAIKLSNVQRRNLFLVAKEALNNALKHSGGGSINLKMEFKDNVINFYIHDNGKGMDVLKTKQASNGVKNMQKRMEEIGGTFVIETNTNGTCIQFALKVSQ